MKVTDAPVLISFFVIGMAFRILALCLTYIGVGHGFYESNPLYNTLGPSVFYVSSALSAALLYTGVMFAAVRYRLHPAIFVAAGLTFIIYNAYDALGDLVLVLRLNF